jgi:hypothetical protein
VASLDEDLDQAPWAHVNLENKASWFTIADDLPQFEAYPDLAELGELAKKNAR